MCGWSVDDWVKLVAVGTASVGALSVVWSLCLYCVFAGLGRLFRGPQK